MTFCVWGKHNAYTETSTKQSLFAEIELNKYDIKGETLQRPFLCNLAKSGRHKRRPCVKDSSEWLVSKGPGQKKGRPCVWRTTVSDLYQKAQVKRWPCVWRTAACDLYQKVQVKYKTTLGVEESSVWIVLKGPGETKDDLVCGGQQRVTCTKRYRLD